VAKLGALRLTLLDLLLIAGIAVASFWLGQLTAAYFADSIIGEPVPDVTFQIRYGVTSDKGSISSLEAQQQIVSYQIALTRTLLEAEQIDLAHATGAGAASLATEVSESSSLLGQLKVRQTTLSDNLDRKNRALATDEYHAQKSATRSSSLRRIGVWAIQVMGALSVFAGLTLLLLVMRMWIRRGLHARVVLLGALVVLGALLLTAYAGWVGLMLISILVVSFFVTGSRHGNVRAQ